MRTIKRPNENRKARVEYESRYHLSELMLSYGWHAVKWTRSGRPCWFAYQTTRNELLWGAKRCFLIGSKNGQGTAWTLRWIHKWVPVKGQDFVVPVQNHSYVMFQTAVGVALWHDLFKPELPR